MLLVNFHLNQMPTKTPQFCLSFLQILFRYCPFMIYESSKLLDFKNRNLSVTISRSFALMEPLSLQ